MEWKTHFLLGAMVGATYTHDWKGALIGGGFALISDLDEPNSKLGRLLFPISMLISSIFPHRTFTHSIPFTLLIGLAMYLFTFNPTIAIVAMLGVASHIVGDILTGKVQLFYPFHVWVGVEIPSIAYTLIDRVSRYALLFLCLVYIYRNMGEFLM